MTAAGLSRPTAMVAAMAAFAVGGLADELLLLAGHPELGIAVIVPLMILVAWLWRPAWPVLGIIGVSLGIELLLPLQTGGGRYQDWLLHYQMALHYAGQPNHVLAQALRWRTPLYHQLAAGLLAQRPDYWTLQLGSILLSSMWLWPASLLIRERAQDAPALRLLAVGLAPIVLAYATYTWPWSFAAFFVLAAIWLQGQAALWARIGVGIALAGALLVHPGTAGYVLGIGLVWIHRHRSAALPGVAAAVVVMASAVPWIIAVSANIGPQELATGSLPIVAATSPILWVVSRLLLVAHTFFPEPITTPDRLWVSLVLQFLVLSLPGAVLVALVAGRIPRPPRELLVCCAAGGLAALAIYPADNYLAGMMDPLYPAILVFLVFVAGAFDASTVRRMFLASVALGGCFAALLLWVSASPISGDSNLILRTQYQVVYFVSRWGILPGLATLAAAAVACTRFVAREWTRPARGTPPA